MKTYFLDYLTNLQAYIAQEAATKKASRKKSAAALSKSQLFVQQAFNGSIDNLSRLFNEFPLYYSLDSQEEAEKIFSAIPLNTYRHWCHLYCELIDLNAFGAQINADALEITTTRIAAEKAKCFISKLITQACEDLLDEEGKLHPSFVKAFKLGALIEKYKDSQELDNIIYHLIFSYCTQLVLAGLFGIIFNRTPVSDEADFKKYGQQVKQGDYINRFLREMLVISDEHHALHFTCFFKQKIIDCIALRAMRGNDSTVFIRSLLKRENNEDLPPEIKQLEKTENQQPQLVEDIKIFLQQHDTNTQLKMLDGILANNALGSLIGTSKPLWLGKASSFVKYIQSWLTWSAYPATQTPAENLAQYRENLLSSKTQLI